MEIVRAIYNVAFYPLIGLILQSDDHSELQVKPQDKLTFLLGSRQY